MRRFPTFVTAIAMACAAAIATPGLAAPEQPGVANILAANRTAVGKLPSKGSAEVDYSYSGSGLEGSRTDIVDLDTGAFIVTLQADIVGEARGFDGKTPWMRDTSGANTAQEGGDRIAVAVNEAYRFGNLWWRPRYAGATVTYAGRASIDGRTLDQLVVTPKRGKPFGAWFDSSTHLLARITEDQQFFHKRILYADYRRESGVLLPHEVTIDNGTGKESYEYLHLKRFSLGAARPLTAYSRPTAPPTGASLDAGATSATVPFRLLNNHIYVEALVNGRGPYTFLVDTGGHALIAPTLVAEVGLKIVGATAMAGAGEKTESAGFTRVKEIALGAARLHDQLGFTAPIYDSAIEGIRVDGMFGFELFRRFAVQIDYGRQVLTLTDPTRFDATGAGTAIPFVFYDHLPMVRGSIGDLPARFDIDTGSRSEVDITSPFAAAHALHARFSKGVSAVTGWGVGGPSRSYVVRLPSLTLGSVRVASLVAGLSEDKGGSISDPNYEGNIGSGFLKRFVVTFDYAHQVMYLRPIVPAPDDAGHFARAGKWINSGPKGYVVTDVAVNGPAAQAGIQVGDIITRMDGAAPRFDGLSDTRLLLRSRPAGTRVEVELQRAGEVRQTALTLRDQI
ncbi:MAG TPA: aspartyl protease family protein [Steroidobacteraceae bacterium]